MSSNSRASTKRKLPARLSAAPEFRKLFAMGRRLRGERINLLFMKRADTEPSRWGIAVGRKFGTAVKRNRLRRVARELVNELGGDFPQGYTMVLEVLSRANTFSQREVRTHIQSLLTQAKATLQARLVPAVKS